MRLPTFHLRPLHDDALCLSRKRYLRLCQPVFDNPLSFSLFRRFDAGLQSIIEFNKIAEDTRCLIEYPSSYPVQCDFPIQESRRRELLEGGGDR